MIPLRDVIPSRTFPFFTVSFIVLNSVAFLFELSLPRRELQKLVYVYGVVPAHFDALSFITSMFLHGGWGHFFSNMLFLWIFGDNVEDRLGHARFVVFYLLCGVSAAVAHVYMNPTSTVPTIGASGAIAGVLGAYFVLYPHSRVLALVPLFIIVEVPALIFLGFWFMMQLYYVGSTDTNVAFWAHIAGFAAGIAGVLVLRKPSRHRWRSELT
jgi:membrane associated rhomboid family serine protease